MIFVAAYLITGLIAYLGVWGYYHTHGIRISFAELFAPSFQGNRLWSLFFFIVLWPIAVHRLVNSELLSKLKDVLKLIETEGFEAVEKAFSIPKAIELQEVANNRLWVGFEIRPDEMPTAKILLRIQPHGVDGFIVTHVVMSAEGRPWACGRYGVMYSDVPGLSQLFPFEFLTEEGVSQEAVIELADKDEEWLTLCVESKAQERVQFQTDRSSKWLIQK